MSASGLRAWERHRISPARARPCLALARQLVLDGTCMYHPSHARAPRAHRRDLLRGLITVYLHADAVDLKAGNPPGGFAGAVGGDERSFRPEYFMEVGNLRGEG
jgi:hypothetical protein